MNKTIIAVYETAKKGKSQSIKNVCKKFLANFPTANLQFTFHPNSFSYKNDICVIIELNGIRIGIESQGDPSSRLITEKNIELENGVIAKDASGTLEKLALYNCDIIICASRTEGGTVKKVDNVANRYGYHTLWKSSNHSPGLNHDVLNNLLADEIINLIKSIIVGQL